MKMSKIYKFYQVVKLKKSQAPNRIGINPLVPDAHYSERQDEPFSLQIQRLKVDLKLNCGFLFFASWAPMG